MNFQSIKGGILCLAILALGSLALGSITCVN